MLSEVPEGWEKAALSDLFLIKSSKRVLRSQWRKSGVPFYRGREISALAKDGSVDNELFIDEGLYEELSQKHGTPSVGDILVTAIGTIGNAYLVREDQRFYFKDASVLWLENFGEAEADFIIYWFQSSLFMSQLDVGNGTTVDSLTISSLKSCGLSLPPLPEQKRIAEILSSVDESIQATQSVIDQAERVKRGLMEDLLTGGLGSEAIARGEVPEGWKSVRQGDVSKFFNGRAYKLSEWEDSGTPVIRLQNLTGTGKNYYYSNLDLPEHQYCHKGDLLFMWSASFGPYLWWGGKAIYHYHIWKVTHDEGFLRRKYHYFLLEFFTEVWKSDANGMAMLHLTKKWMEELKISLPPLPEQKRIAEILSSVDVFIQSQKQIIDQYQVTKKGLMDDLLTGKVRTA